MAKIARIELLQVDLAPKVVRTDAIQSFVTQETPFIRVIDTDGAVGTGYSYTIGTGGSSVMALLKDHLAPRLIGREAGMVFHLPMSLRVAGRFGICLSHTMLVTAEGGVALTRTPARLREL